MERDPDEDVELRELEPIRMGGSPERSGRPAFVIVCVGLVALVITAVVIAVGSRQDAPSAAFGDGPAILTPDLDGNLVEVDAITLETRRTVADRGDLHGLAFAVASGADTIAVGVVQKAETGDCGEVVVNDGKDWRRVTDGLPSGVSKDGRYVVVDKLCGKSQRSVASTLFDLATTTERSIDASTDEIWRATDQGFARLPARCENGVCAFDALDPVTGQTTKQSLPAPPGMARLLARTDSFTFWMSEPRLVTGCELSDVIRIDASGHREVLSDFYGRARVLADARSGALLMQLAGEDATNCEPSWPPTTAPSGPSPRPLNPVAVWDPASGTFQPAPVSELSAWSPATAPPPTTTTAPTTTALSPDTTIATPDTTVAVPPCSSYGAAVDEQDGLLPELQQTRTRLLDALSRCDLDAINAMVTRQDNHFDVVRVAEQSGLPALAAFVEALEGRYWCADRASGAAVDVPCVWIATLDARQLGPDYDADAIVMVQGLSVGEIWVRVLRRQDWAAECTNLAGGAVGASGPPRRSAVAYPLAEWPTC